MIHGRLRSVAVFAALALGCLPSAGLGQAVGWDANLIIDPFPPPYLSDWEMNPTLASLVVTNGSGRDAFVTVDFSVTDGSGRVVLRGRSEPQFMPTGAQTTLNTGSSLGGTSNYDPAIEDAISRTGRLPEGDYTACLTLSDGSGFIVADQVCAYFSTVYPDPPYLLFPMSGDTVTVADPIFEWTPVQVPLTLTPQYVIQIAELLPGQSPYTALTSGDLQLDDIVPFAPSLQYPLGALPLTHGKRYAWWVRAVDESGVPLSANQGRSEIWTFTYFQDGGGDPGGEEIGGSDHARIVHTNRAGAGPLADLGTASFASVRDALEDVADEELRIPLPIGGVDAFEDLPLSNVRVEVDEPGAAIAITATASLPMGAANVLLLGEWADGGAGTFTLGIAPLVFDLAEWIPGLDGTPLGELDWTGSILTLASGPRTLDAGLLPLAVEQFYGASQIDLTAGVSVSHELDLRSTAIHDRLAGVGLDVSTAELSGTLGIEPSSVFAAPGEREAPSLDLVATLLGARLADTPDWLSVERYTLRFTNDPDLAVHAEMEAEAAFPDRSLRFVLALDIEDDGAPPVLTGRMTTPWEAPFGIAWLTLDSVRLAITPPADAGDPTEATLTGEMAVGPKTVLLSAEIEGTGDAMEATLRATLDELAVGDLLAFVEAGFGAPPFADQIPDDIASLRGLTLEFRSGDPPTFSVLATASALGQSTELLYASVPSGDGEPGALLGLRLADWSLGNMIPPLDGSAIGDLRFPAVSFVLGPDGVPAPAEDDSAAAVAWSIPWASLGDRVRGFLEPSIGPGPAPLPPDEDGVPNDPSTLDLRPGLNFSAPFSLSQITAGLGDLFGHRSSGVPAPEEEPTGGDVVMRGSPGLSLADLLSGAPDLSALLDMRVQFPPLPENPAGWPDWATPRDRSLRIFRDPEVRVVARATVDADLDGPKTFHLATELTNVDGAGASLEGLMEGGWERPFGVDWLTLDTVHLAVSAGSTGPRFALGSTIEVGSVTGGLGIDVRGTAEDRVVDFTARARDVSTTDVVAFLNHAFDADITAPASALTLDSIAIGFTTGDAAAFHLNGGFAAGIDPAEALLAVAALLPGYTAPAELPFEVGTLAGAWFDVHVVADSVWGGVGGVVALGGAPAAPTFEGSAAIRLAASRVADEAWLALDLDLGARDLSAADALSALSETLPGEWSLPPALDAAAGVSLDSARLRFALDLRTDSTSVALTGAGSHVDDGTAFRAGLDLGLFDVADSSWTTGALALDLRDVPVSEALAHGASLLPGEWGLPPELDERVPVRLDSATVTVAFDSRGDSLSAVVRGAGTLAGPDGIAAEADAAVVQAAGEEWASGRVSFAIQDLEMPAVLDRVATLLPGEWSVPADFAAFNTLRIDEGDLELAFDTRTENLTARARGTGVYGDGASALDVRAEVAFSRVAEASYASGLLGMELGDVSLDQAFARATELLPGDWAAPAVPFDIGSLRGVTLEAGFDTRADSLWAGVDATATLAEREGRAVLTVASVDARSWAAGTFRLDIGDITLPGALELASDILPGGHRVPQLEFDLGGIGDVLLEAGFRAGDADTLWVGFTGGFDLGSRTLALEAVLEGDGDDLEARFTASADELAMGDFLAFAERAVGTVPFVDQLPGDLAALRNLHLEFRTGAPATFTALATAAAFGQSTDLLFTFVPAPSSGGAPGGVFGVRLADWSLAGMIPALAGNPIGDLRLPAASFVRGWGGELPEDLAGSTPEDGEPAEPGAGWSIPWTSFSVGARDFLLDLYPDHPGPGPDGPTLDPEDDDPMSGGRSSLTLNPGLNFSAPFSLSQLPSGLRALLSFGLDGGGDSGTGGNLPPPGGGGGGGAGGVVIRGAPGISLNGLFSGVPDLSGLLDLGATLPPLPANPVGWPDWLTPRSRSIQVFRDPEVRLVARAVIDADLDGPKRFDLAAELTNGGDAGAALEGTMEGAWEQPFGLTWLTLDSVSMALGAGSVGARVALGSSFDIGGVSARVDMDVRGTGEERVVDFSALARDLSTADVVDFLNHAFEAGLAPPSNPVTLDSMAIAFTSGDAAAFHLTGAFSTGMDAAAALLALADLLPGYSAPAELPFQLGTLGEAWFDLHVVPDSVWGGYGGTVVVGDPGAAGFEGSAAIRIGGHGGDDEPWLDAELDLAGRDLESDDALAALASVLPGDWAMPAELTAVGNASLDSARLRIGIQTRSDSASAELTGAGRFEGDAGQLAAALRLGLFAVGEASWGTGALMLDLRDVPVTAALAQAASVLPGEWTMPAELDALAPVHFDSATLTLGFDSRDDSLSARVLGAGTLGGADGLAAAAELTLVQAAESWASGSLALRIGTMSLPDALEQAATLLPADWSLPDALSGLAPLMLDSATLGVAFDSRTALFMSDIAGASHLGEGASRLDGSMDLSLAAVEGDQFAHGQVTFAVRDIAMSGLLAEVAGLLPGTWALPEGFTAFDALRLDEGELAVAFDTRIDSLSARAQGAGRLGEGTAGFDATADLAFIRVADASGASGSVELARGALTMNEALAQIAGMLPGSWELPSDLDAFDRVALDDARFLLGFDTWADSIFAGVRGSGGFDGLDAEARLDFLRLPAGDRVSGLLSLALGSVGAGQAVERIAGLLPGDWSLPAGFDSFDALTLDSASLHAGFDTGGDSLWAGFQGGGRLSDAAAEARLGFSRIAGASNGSGLVTLDLGDVSLGDAFGRATAMLPGDWPAPAVDFPIDDLRDVRLELGFDTRADSLWAGVGALARLAERDGQARLSVVSVGGSGGTARSWATGTFRLDVGDVTLPGALELAASLVPGSPEVPTLEFDLGGISGAVLEAGFRAGDRDSAWTALTGGFRLGSRTARAEVALALGSEQPGGHFRAAFDDPFGVSDVVQLLAGFMPNGGVDLPPLGPLDVRLDRPTLTLSFGERSGVSLSGGTQIFDKPGDALFSFSRIDGRPQLILGVQVPDLGFGDIVPGMDNPITDQLQLALAALTVTRAEGRVPASELSDEERAFYKPLSGGDDDDFSVDFRPGLNLTGLIPLASAGALKDMVDMLSPGASNLTLQGTLPLPGFGGGFRDLALSAQLPPMAPPGSPAWFVAGEVALQITGRPSVGLAGALTLDVEGDTLTFDIESNIAVVPAGVELSIAGGLVAVNPWVAPLGIEWLTLNEIRLALGLSPVAVRLGFLGDAIIGPKDIRIALGTKLNIYSGVPIGALLLAETDEGLSLGELVEFQAQVAGSNAPALPLDALPDMAVREMGIRVATYTDFDLGIEAGIGLRGAFLLQAGRDGDLSEFGRIALSIDRQGILGLAQLTAFGIGPVHFDEALLDLALTAQQQHLFIKGGASIDNRLSADIELAMTRDSMSFSTGFSLFDQFQADLHARAGFQLTNPNFAVRAVLASAFSDDITYGVVRDLIPAGQTALTGATLALDAAQDGLVTAESVLASALWAAEEVPRATMNAAYALYLDARNRYSSAHSSYIYHRNRCSWRNAWHCSMRNYWWGVRGTWLSRSNIRWGAYSIARTAYENREYLQNNPAVDAARNGLSQARLAFNDAQAGVNQLETILGTGQKWIDAYDTCASCSLPSIPIQVLSAEAEAELAGFFDRSRVEMTVRYQLFGEQNTLNAGFGGSLSELVQPIFSAASNALF